MKRIDRLLIKVNKAYKKNSRGLYMAFVIQQEDGSWEAQGQLWNGKTGSGTKTLKINYSTQEEAVESINKLAAEYPNKEEILVFIFYLNRTT